MAEAYLRTFGGLEFDVESAGWSRASSIRTLSAPLRRKASTSRGKKTQDVFELYKAGQRYDYVITVCSKGSG